MGPFMDPLLQLPRHLDDYADATTPKIPDVYPPREGKPEYASNMEFWAEGTNARRLKRDAKARSCRYAKMSPAEP